MQRWRLICHQAGSGAWNMAADLAILEAYRKGLVPPTLRLYDWDIPTLSLGYAQPLSDVDHHACAQAGVSIVRRPTGGRAVLHGFGDLTYSVVASSHEGFPDSVAGSYCMIAKAIALSLEILGLSLDLAAGDRPSNRSSACFATATRADLMASGRKLVGSAQVRKEGGFLQHGTLMLTQRPEDIERLLSKPEAPAQMTNLLELMGQADPQRVRSALVEGFAKAFGARFERGDLSPDEEASARLDLASRPGASSGTSCG